MAEIDFVPNDYVQRREARRTNYFYLGLFALMFAGFWGAFGFLKLRQRALSAEEAIVNAKMTEAGRAIQQLEQLQKQREDMMKTALLTAELIEPIPRSIVVALLTNSMPDGLSLTRIKLMRRKSSSANTIRYKSKYEAMKATRSANKTVDDEYINSLNLRGLAGNDIAVAEYIADLTNSILLDEVYLVQSKEGNIKKGNFREFELSAILKTDVCLTKKDVENIINCKKQTSRQAGLIDREQ